MRVRGDPPPAPFANRRGRGDPGARRQLGAFPGLARQRRRLRARPAGRRRWPARRRRAARSRPAWPCARTNMDRRLSRDCDRSWRSSAALRRVVAARGGAPSAAWPAAGLGGAVAGQARGVGRQAGDVLGQLAVQESQRIGARGEMTRKSSRGRRRRNLRRWTESKLGNRAWRRVWWRPAQDGAASHLQRSDDSRLRYGSRPIPRAVQGRVARVAYHSVPISSVGPARDPLNFRNL